VSYSQALLVQRIRHALGEKPWETIGSAASSTSVVSVANGDDWAVGDVGEFVTDGDTFWVSDVAGFDLTAVRGYYGSTAASHAASSRIYKNPKYSYNEITNAISSTIQAFLPWPRVYKVASDTITPSPTDTKWYDTATDVMALINVYQLTDNTPTGRTDYGQFHNRWRVELDRHLPTSLVASGIGLRFPGGFFDVDNTVYITYAAKITDQVTSTNYTDFTDSNAVIETILYGTVALLQGALELRKPRRGASDTNNLQSASYFNRIYHSALAQAEKELRQNSPLMIMTRNHSGS
jgi:hypothetical protein